VDPLSPEQTAQLTEQAKRQLRRRLGALRSAHPPAALSLRSGQIVEQVLELGAFREARAVALFHPIQEKHEVDVRPLDAAAREQGKRVFYPFMDRIASGFETGFREVREVSMLAERGRGFLEPDPRAYRATQGDLDLVIVPALGVAASGHRLGYGAGFYDVTLPEFCPPARSLVVAFDFQMLAELPAAPHDVVCDVVVTDKRVVTTAGI
jgi:5-formyltetrahydrofolate cyclo-ligase